MIQTQKSALIRLEFLSQIIPELKLGTALYVNVMGEAGKLKSWLGYQGRARDIDTGNVRKII